MQVNGLLILHPYPPYLYTRINIFLLICLYFTHLHTCIYIFPPPSRVERVSSVAPDQRTNHPKFGKASNRHMRPYRHVRPARIYDRRDSRRDGEEGEQGG